MTDPYPAFLVARLLGITSSVFLSGFGFSCSYLAMPALSLVPVSQQLAQWQKIYDLGKVFSPPCAAASFVFWNYAAYHSLLSNGLDAAEWKMYATAGVLSLCVIIWTLVVMMPINKELMSRAKIAGDIVESERIVFEQEIHISLNKWDTLNYWRAVFPMVGGLVGVVAALK